MDEEEIKRRQLAFTIEDSLNFQDKYIMNQTMIPGVPDPDIFDPTSKDYFYFDYHVVQSELHERMEELGLAHEETHDFKQEEGEHDLLEGDEYVPDDGVVYYI